MDEAKQKDGMSKGICQERERLLCWLNEVLEAIRKIKRGKEIDGDNNVGELKWSRIV